MPRLTRLIPIPALLLASLLPAAAAGAAPEPLCFGRRPTITGTPGADTLVGTSGSDIIASLAGDDTVHGKGGRDFICAGPGADRVGGGSGGDLIQGGGGSDTLNGDGGTDRIAGGAGLDRCAGEHQLSCEAPLIPPNPGDSRDCSDFATRAAAQAWFERYLPYYGDVAPLDSDGDGIACEGLP